MKQSARFLLGNFVGFFINNLVNMYISNFSLDLKVKNDTWTIMQFEWVQFN